jgi:hypothetical protein
MAIDAAREILDDARRRAVVGTALQTELDGQPTTVEIDGRIFRRERDQDEARQLEEQRVLWAEIRSYGVPQELLTKLDVGLGQSLLDEFEGRLRSIGHMLVFHGQHALWQAVYFEHRCDDCYHVGDETLFLLRQPTSGYDDYQGPPGPEKRLNSAIERVAEMRRRAAAPQRAPRARP